jgi:copper oxidase (laccase) domain-containing protein
MVDLQSIVTYQLEKLGVKNKKIVDLKECTCCQKKRYHSFRRDGKDAGRMIAILGWN